MLRRRIFLSAVLLLPLTAGTAPAQMLSRPGWQGTGLAPEVWWKHTTAFVRLPADTTFAEAARQFDKMSVLGSDSMILPDLAPAGDSGGTPTAALAAGAANTVNPISPRFGTEEEFDALLHEASARRMHVLLRAPLARLAANPAEVRFWMNRGISGFDLGVVTAADRDTARTLRAALDHFPGRRILMAREPAEAAATQPQQPTRRAQRASTASPITLRIVSLEDEQAGTSPAASQAAPASQVVELAAQPAAPAAATPSENSTIVLPNDAPLLPSLMPLLLAHGTPLLDIRLLDTEADRAALQQVLGLRSSHAAFQSGTARLLDTDNPSLHAWLLQASGRSRENLLAVQNTGAEPAVLHLRQALSAAGIHADYLQALLRSDHGMGSVNIDTGTLPPGTAILAEIHGDRYAPAPATAQDSDEPPATGKRHRHHRK